MILASCIIQGKILRPNERKVESKDTVCIMAELMNQHCDAPAKK